MATKRAVCVGINYPGTSAQLSGCVNDANDWAQLLRSQGYTEVQILLDAGATKAAIVKALIDAVGALKWGDKLVFTYSGHGTWLPDRSGDEADQRDEALVPIDYKSGALITDDELEQIFSAVPSGASALILSDSCHSGTMTRLANLEPAADESAPRFLPPHELLDELTEDQAIRMERDLPASKPRATASLISGCGDLEYSYDAWFGSRANGAMTRSAIDSFQPGISLNNWFKAIRTRLPSAQYPQTPELTASSLYRKYTRAI